MTEQGAQSAILVPAKHGLLSSGPAHGLSVGLALSGGGSRAMAFHLGCLRALHDRGILEHVRVMSTVSGGSVIGAMYAYSSDPFDVFDERVVSVLRRGIMWPLVRRLLSPVSVMRSIATMMSASVLAAGATAVQTLVRAFGSKATIRPPLRRWYTRTIAFQEVLDSLLFDHRTVDAVRRHTRHGILDVIINSTELRTGTAFRFGNQTVGGSRFGVLEPSKVAVSLAVAASAAYPALLPAIDAAFDLAKGGQRPTRHRLLLTDGGVYDNLGTAPLEPGRDVQVSTHAKAPNVIIACDAGLGVIDGDRIPYWWPTRMIASFETIFRRVQNDTRNRLHRYSENGDIRGFILAYLGQQDSRLPWRPGDFVKREDVAGYPTNFSAMSEENIRRLTTRGEQLMRCLISHYLPEL